jgi:serine/threonine protein kinase
VYEALDTRLDRVVAIKLSAERFGEHFEREARAVASLNHPNICQLYDVGPNYLVMELVEGPTLAERIKEGTVRLEETLAVARLRILLPPRRIWLAFSPSGKANIGRP